MQTHFIQHLPVRNHCRKRMYSTQGVQKNALTEGPKSLKNVLCSKVTPTYLKLNFKSSTEVKTSHTTPHLYNTYDSSSI